MSQVLSVAEAKRQLRTARINEHKESIRKALTANDDVALARASNRFFTSFTQKGKKVKK